MTPGAMVPVGDYGGYLCVPALTFPQLAKYRDQLKVITSANFLTVDPETLDHFVGMACDAVKRNHPDVTPVKLFELLDLRSAQLILIALLGGSGKYVMPEVTDDEEMHRASDEVIGVCFNGRAADA